MLLQIHSQTSLITNSSTTIYPKSENCIVPAKALINEFLITFNLPYKCDEIFQLDVIMDEYFYEKYWLKMDKKKQSQIKPSKVYQDVIEGNLPKPDWYIDAEKNGYKYDHQSFLYIFPKDEKYAHLAAKLKTFLYSWYAEEGEG